jgi:hypothetical protein
MGIFGSACAGDHTLQLIFSALQNVHILQNNGSSCVDLDQSDHTLAARCNILDKIQIIQYNQILANIQHATTNARKQQQRR